MQIPPFLKKGSTVAITCPSGFIPKEQVYQAKDTLESWGFHVLIGKTVGESENYFSADDTVRKEDLQHFLDHKNVDAILMGRGGFGMSRIIDDLDFTQFILQPKWICGFSDITVIHSHIQTNYGIASLHSPMCSSLTEGNREKDFLKSFLNVIQGFTVDYPIPYSSYNVEGRASGTIVGGNLAMLSHLSGSRSAMNTVDKILFIEDIGEHLYGIDRMLYNLKRTGAFDRIKGVICGGFTDLEDTTRPYGKTIQEIILHHFSHLNIPILFDFPTGHINENYPLMLGVAHDLVVGKDFRTLLTRSKQDSNSI